MKIKILTSGAVFSLMVLGMACSSGKSGTQPAADASAVCPATPCEDGQTCGSDGICRPNSDGAEGSGSEGTGLGATVIDVDGSALTNSVDAFGEALKGTVGDALAIGWYERPSVTGKQANAGTGIEYTYANKSEYARICRDAGNPQDCGATRVILPTVSLKDQRIEVDVTVNEHETWAILFRTNEQGTSGYSFEYNTYYHRWVPWQNGEKSPYGAYVLSKMAVDPQDASKSTGAMVALRNLESESSATTHHIKIEAVGDRITIYDGDAFVFSISDGGHPEAGRIGFSTWLATSLKVDHLKVTNLTSYP